MEYAIAALVGLLFTAAVWLLLSRSLLRMLLGLVLLGNAANLLILIAGRLTRSVPPIVPEGATAMMSGAANPLPQALILTAIVIGFAMFAYLLVLAYRTYADLEVEDTDNMRLAEPPGEPRPPLSY
jgi:multicomponent Na+:H+ antiporter subunit C